MEVEASSCDGEVNFKIIEQLKEEARLQQAATNSRDFQEFSNLVENLAVTMSNIGRSAKFSSGMVIKELL
jgi:hypothetical protein